MPSLEHEELLLLREKIIDAYEEGANYISLKCKRLSLPEALNILYEHSNDFDYTIGL